MQMILIRGMYGKAEMNLADTYPADEKSLNRCRQY